MNGPATLCTDCSVYGYCSSCGEQIASTCAPSSIPPPPKGVSCSHCHTQVLNAEQILAAHGQLDAARAATELKGQKIYMSSGFEPGAKLHWFDDPEDNVSRGLHGHAQCIPTVHTVL
jgi:hypothetical protein